MSTINASIALNLLSGSTGGSGLLGSLYGSATVTSSDPVGDLKRAETNQAKAIAAQAKDPATKRDTDHFLAVVAKATDLKTVLADPIARKVLLTANGLGDQADYVALATKALSSDTTKPDNLAAKLGDSRWLAVAQTFDFAHKGLTVLKDPNVLRTITGGYAEVRWRQSLDETTPGLSAALDFRARAASIKNVDEILGNSNLRTVVTGALGLPPQIAYQPLTTQEKAITDRLDLSKLKDPKFVEQFARRFLIENSVANSSGFVT